MKKVFLGGTLVVAIAILGTLNVQLTKVESNFSNLELANMILSAEANDVEWNHWSQWPSQGLTKDEREVERPCPTHQESSGSGGVSGGNGAVNGSANGSGSSSQDNPINRYDITCGSGSSNCTSIGC